MKFTEWPKQIKLLQNIAFKSKDLLPRISFIFNLELNTPIVSNLQAFISELTQR